MRLWSTVVIQDHTRSWLSASGMNTARAVTPRPRRSKSLLSPGPSRADPAPTRDPSAPAPPRSTRLPDSSLPLPFPPCRTLLSCLPFRLVPPGLPVARPAVVIVQPRLVLALHVT